jgi:hypothetical protein
MGLQFSVCSRNDDWHNDPMESPAAYVAEVKRFQMSAYIAE